MRKNVYPVGQVNRYIKNMFAQDFMLQRISIKGEVSNLKYHTSGHIYFTLKDEAGAISAVMFSGSRRTGLSFRMKDGDKVIVTGSVEVYEKNGSYQLYARQIEQDGEGNLYLRFEALKRELEEMGMFAQEYKQPIPSYAKTVGVVTAQTGAAIQDIRNITHRRNPYVQLILYPAQVQGEGAAETIVRGIRILENMAVDVIIVGRGGGSIEDLWAFNEEIVARAIFDCRVPIISAVGHETDWTIADFVADLRAPTPSAAAELAVYDIREVDRRLNEDRRRMDAIISRRLDLAREKLAHQKTRLRWLSPAMRLNENRRQAADLEANLHRLMKQKAKDRRQELTLLTGRMEAASPLKKLSSGYAFVSDENGRGLTSIQQVKTGDPLDVYLLDGRLKVRTEAIYEESYGRREQDAGSK